MSCYGVRLSKQQSKGINEEMFFSAHFEGVYYTLEKEAV